MDEELEKQLEVAKRIHEAGYIDQSHFEEHRDHAMNGLCLYGNSFERALGEALTEATLDDELKILRYWRQSCDRASILWKMKLAQEKAS